jgi:uncharacterized cupin superfamily protein
MEQAVFNIAGIKPRTVDVGHLRGDWTFLGPAIGCRDVGVRRIQVEPGFFSTPLHVHAHDEETFFVLAGSGVSLQDDRAHEVRAGDCIVHGEAGEAHTLRAGDDGLDVLAFGVSREVSSGARLPRVGMTWSARSWFETGAGKSPFEREAELGPPDVPPPSERPSSIVNLDEAEAHESERKNHSGTWRSLAKQAGAKRTGLNHIALAPGQMGAPPHCHASEEEVFVVLEGDGTLLLGDDPHPVKPLDIVARPAGTGVAHSFTAGENGLTFLAYGPWKPDEIVYYPRSNKIAFFGVGIITRVEKLDYWDGEE